MKKLVLFLMISLFAVSGISAQQRQQRQRPTAEDMAKRQTETLTKELSLTDAQKEKVYKINLKYAQPREQQNTNVDREKRREEFQKLFKERTDSIKTVLTDEQKVKFDKHLKDMQNRPRGERNRR